MLHFGAVCTKLVKHPISVMQKKAALPKEDGFVRSEHV